jgi:peptidoglycan/LPS O-acetylase OafA/YrhL
MSPSPKLEPLLKYRSDVDGLRAVAVLSVFAYHLGLPLHGGYVGVDIFFTISGFLIGSIILRQSAEGNFTFAGFYERRIRRIFPALFAMLFVVSIIAYNYALPVELVSYGKSLAFVALSISNVYFWFQSGYFDAPASATPLLHTWSLAVEEQFYVFLPLFLILIRRFAPRRVNLSIILFAAGSFLISAYGAYRFPSAAFYLAHTRAWELLLGTILALDGFPQLKSRLTREVAGISGIALLLAPILFYQTATPFPGLAALPPCLGTALIIAAGSSGKNCIGRLLSLKPIVFIGLISYSLYLWHWPLIVFYKFGFTVLSGLTKHESQGMLFTLSVFIAVLSWRFVELPFRTRVIAANRYRLFGGATFATVFVLAGSSAFVVSQGVPSRYSQRARNVAAYLDGDPIDGRDQWRRGECFIVSEDGALKDFSVSKCLSEKTDQKNVLILGDSHAAAMWWGFEQLFPSVNVMQATSAGCKPVLNQRPRQRSGCVEIMNYVLKDFLMSHKVDAVLIEAHWDEGDLASLGETISWLQRNRIPTVLVGPMVQYDSPLPRLLALAISETDPLLPVRHLEKFVEPLDQQMKALARVWDVPYVSIYGLLCSNKLCTQYGEPDVPLLFDYGHFTKAGSILAARKIAALGILPIDVPQRAD